MNEGKRLAVFYNDDLPNMASHCRQATCGFSLYRGVLVQWDEDSDTRVLGVLDELTDAVRDRLLVVQEHEGCIAFVWEGEPPEGYCAGDCVVAPDGDEWNIGESATAPAVVEVDMRAYVLRDVATYLSLNPSLCNMDDGLARLLIKARRALGDSDVRP